MVYPVDDDKPQIDQTVLSRLWMDINWQTLDSSSSPAGLSLSSFFISICTGNPSPTLQRGANKESDVDHLEKGACINTYVKDVGDAERLEDLGAGGVVVAPEEEEIQHLGWEGGFVPHRCAIPVRRLPAVAAHPADLPLLELVVVPADPARVLPLPFPHRLPAPLPPPPRRSAIPAIGRRRWDRGLPLPGSYPIDKVDLGFGSSWCKKFGGTDMYRVGPSHHPIGRTASHFGRICHLSWAQACN